ncbi:Hypothetical predicted protein [Paramuricea clavata]|uniref:Uncharacterized protein n=1 Tax=Paramuricea clavata TaxID=317549 RepID=A0A6S7IF83_PARCT|nr:Hypothetical predicted protein [Paramuricea clavata]
MPLKGFLSKLGRRKSPGLFSSGLPSHDECKEEHKKIFRPTLDTLVRKFATKRRLFDQNYPLNILAFLEDIGFFKELRSTYPNVELSIDMQDNSLNAKLCLKGRGEEFDAACNKLFWKLGEITKSALPFDDRRIWDAIADTRVQEHIKSVLTLKNIRAQVCAGDTGNLVIITAMNNIELRKAKDLLLDLIEIKTVSIPEDVDRHSESGNIKKFLTKQEGSLPIKIYFHPSNVLVQIVGVAEAVTKAISTFRQFFESMRIKRQFFIGNRKLTPDVWTFLEMHFDEIKKAKEEKFLNLKVSVKLEKQPSGNHQISMTGTEESFPACNNILEELIMEITQKDELIEFPGLQKLFDAQIGKHELERIGKNCKVYIKVQPSAAIPRSATVSSHSTQSGYERYNITTKEGVQLSCKIGRIENEKVS